jgi:hypothetical protein
MDGWILGSWSSTGREKRASESEVNERSSSQQDLSELIRSVCGETTKVPLGF